ncbi:MAG TPA: hypothetical protein VFH61_17280, partial [Thermoleophilia bacterium]|nr:hypothetical protein [Thermoleophilia bacterium]
VTPVNFLRSKGLDVRDIPPNENAALDYLIAAEMLPPFPRDIDREARARLRYEEDYVLRYGWSDECALLWSRLESAEPALARARIGVGKTNGQTPFLMVDSDVLVWMVLPGLGGRRTVGQWLVRSGKMAEASGRFDQARDSYLAVVVMGNHAAQDGLLLSGLVGVALNVSGLEALERWTLLGPPPALLREALARVQALAPGRPDFDRALRTDRVIFFDVLTVIGTLSEEDSTFSERVGDFLNSSRTVRRIIKAKAAILFGKLDDWYALGAPAQYAALPMIRSEIEAGFRTWSSAPAALWCSARPDNACRYAVNDLRWCAAEVRLGLALYKAEHGRYPEALNDIVPYLGTVPLDPFSAAPLRFRLEGDDYVFYSVGPDLTDDGGKDLRDDMTHLYSIGTNGRGWRGQDDLVFTSKLAPAPPLDEYLRNDGTRPAGGWSTEQPGVTP